MKDYTDWGASGSSAETAKFTGTGSVRGNSSSTGYPAASGGANGYLSGNYDFVINDITPIVGENQFDISFGSAYYDGTADNVFKSSYITVEISNDGGTNWLPVTYTNSDTESDRWDYCTGSVTLPNSIINAQTKLSVRFKGTLASGQLRIDDVKIVSMQAAEPTEPQVVTKAATDVQATTATFNGLYTFSSAATSVGFEYKKESDPATSYKAVGGIGSVEFAATVTDLVGNTSYTVRALAVYDGKTYYGSEMKFTTTDPSIGTVLLNETMGDADASTKPTVDSYTGWSKTGLGDANVTYSGIAVDKVTVRGVATGASSGYNGASGKNYVYFGSVNPNSFFINDISAGNVKNFRIGFGANKYVSGTGVTQTPITNADLKVYYSTTGLDGSYTEIPVTYASTVGAWQYVASTFATATQTKRLWIKFTCDVASAVSIDDITVSTSDTPAIEAVPVVSTAVATAISETGATLGGSYTYTGSGTISEVGIAYKKSTETAFVEQPISPVTTPFSAAVSGLTLGTSYNVKAYVKIGTDVYYGEDTPFSTTGEPAKKTIAEIRAAAVNGATTPEAIIEGTVISDKDGANLQKYQFAMVDGSAENSGIMINLAESGATNTYTVGDKVKVNLKGATYNIYNGLIQIKVAGANISAITTAGGNTTPIAITVDKLDKYESMLVSIATCQVVNEDYRGAVMNSGPTGNNGNVGMETVDGKKFILRTASSAAFKSEPVPQKSGTLIGIGTRYNDDMQVSPRTMADMSAMTADRFGPAAAIAFEAATFEATTANSNEALVDAKIVIPYTMAEGTETYKAEVTVSGAGKGGLPTTITFDVTGIKAGSGEIEIPITGTPGTGEVTFSVAGITTSAITCTKTFAPLGDVRTADLNTIKATNTSYVESETASGWKAKNCAVFKGGANNSAPAFNFISDSDDDRAVCLNGKASAIGVLTSPTLTGGCKKLSFNYGVAFSEKNGVKLRIEFMQNNAAVKTIEFVKPNSDVTMQTAYKAEFAAVDGLDIKGDFSIVITNLCPSNDTGNKDRTAIWDIAWELNK